MQLLEDAFFSRRLPAPEQHRRPIAAQIAEKEAEERSTRSLAAHDSGSSEGDTEAQRCEVAPPFPCSPTHPGRQRLAIAAYMPGACAEGAQS